MLANTSAHRNGLGQVSNGEQATHKQELQPIENKEVRRGRNNNEWKRGIAAGHEGVVHYISSWILPKVSCSLALPTPHKYHRQE